jgi:hypothetical protein
MESIDDVEVVSKGIALAITAVCGMTGLGALLAVVINAG